MVRLLFKAIRNKTVKLASEKQSGLYHITNKVVTIFISNPASVIKLGAIHRGSNLTT